MSDRKPSRTLGLSAMQFSKDIAQPFLQARQSSPTRCWRTRRSRSNSELGYDVRPANPAETTRILANAIVHHMTLSSSGAFEEMTPGSTTAITETRRHAGIVKTARFTFTT
jgi:hypothetical protein